jgi:MFS family permease
MLKYFKPYQKIEGIVKAMIAAEFFIQLVNTAFMMILNIYLSKKGYADHEIADFISYRFLTVMIIAFPIGLFIKGRKLIPFFYAASVGTTICSIGILYAVENQLPNLLYLSLAAWGLSYGFMQVLALPFILRNTSKENQTSAISLSYSTYSIGMIASGLIIYILSKIDPVYFDERTCLMVISLLSALSLFFVIRIGLKEKISGFEGKRRDVSNFDWKVIAKAMTPSLILAVGAGLTIPFINLFFYKVFAVDSEEFSIINAFSSITVALSALLVPHIKSKYGYKVAITRTQTIAVISLVLLACTEFYDQYSWSVYAAIIFYLIRQPLMNMAAPVTSELVINYVGKKNEEIISALTASIWSGSWFLSAIIFRILREGGMHYANVFLITAALYSVGVVWYYFLIIDHEKNVKA